ncbi:MAG: HD domain-containing protein [Lachnospiraceae bacterium]|nr:HD domain-containing protein [Lachnospiraceae bacterium]
MKYIETLHEGERVMAVYLCKQRTSAVTKNGKPYDSMILQDKTGTIDAKIWDLSSAGIEDCDALDYIEVGADVTSFNGVLQMNVKRVRKVAEGEYDPRDYLPVSEKDIEEMYTEMKHFIASIKNPYLKELTTKMLIEDEALVKEYKNHSAAKNVHHGFIGGLLEHSLSVTKVCDFFASNYPMLNRDLLITAAMLHDIGKVKELSAFPMNDYTDEGNLLGHIIIGTEMISSCITTIPGFPPVLAGEVKHLILSHHGELEFGSPKKPALMEAVALSFADNMDAKMETFKELLTGPKDEESVWLGYNRLFESNIRRTTDC